MKTTQKFRKAVSVAKTLPRYMQQRIKDAALNYAIDIDGDYDTFVIIFQERFVIETNNALAGC